MKIWIFLTVLLASQLVLAENSKVDCSDLLKTETFGVYEAPSFLLPFARSYIPFSAKTLRRPADHTDHALLWSSYSRSINNPIEMGIVELLDKDGNVIDQKIIKGAVQQVQGLSAAAWLLLMQNSERKNLIATVRKRHTHPQDNYNSIIPHAFSEPDLNSDKAFRAVLDKGDFRHVRFESWIIFMGDNNFNNLGDIKLGQIKTRGYLVPSRD